jgi:quinol monooxygenase YgiN
MFMRFVQLNIKPESAAAFERFYNFRSAPALLDVEGCLFAHLIQSDKSASEFISFTVWASQEAAERYEAGGLYEELVAELDPFTEDSSEWKIRLNDDMTLDYAPVKQAPTVKGMPVVAGTMPADPNKKIGRDPYVRILSFKVDPENCEEFRRLYNDVTTPQILQVEGCRAAFLIGTGDGSGSVSVTIWDSKEDADRYERSGKFDELFSILRPLLSSLFQWKMSLDPKYKRQTHSSDDVSVAGYHTVAGVEV